MTFLKKAFERRRAIGGRKGNLEAERGRGSERGGVKNGGNGRDKLRRLHRGQANALLIVTLTSLID